MAEGRELYDTDILIWSEQQAALLRRVAAGERVNSPELDWPNIIEEVESVGLNELHAVESLLLQALIHMLKAEAWPLSPAVAAWQAEARTFRRQARRRFSPSMSQLIDLAGLYADALAGLPESIDGQSPRPVLNVCQYTVEELLAEGQRP